MNPSNTVRLLNVYEIKLEMSWECITELDHSKRRAAKQRYSSINASSDATIHPFIRIVW